MKKLCCIFLVVVLVGAALVSCQQPAEDNSEVSEVSEPYVLFSNLPERDFSDNGAPYEFTFLTVGDYANTYASVENKDYLGKGENKDNAINSFTQADKDGTIVYDPNLKDADPDNKYTDAYITVSKSQVVLGKNTAVSDNILKIVGGKAAALHIFESDIIWAGTEWGVENGVAGTDNAPFFTVTLNDADGNAIFTVYAVGIYYVDTVNTTAQFLKLYTSLEDVAEGNAFAYVQAGVAFNLRVEYAASGEYTVFVNNNAAATGVGSALTAMGSVSVALGNNVYDTKVTIKNTCVTSK